MEIKKINLAIGKSAPKTEAVNNFSSNPFGVSFKGNVIQADVFESPKENIGNKISEKSKLFASAIVGNMNNFNNSFKARMNSVVSFGQKIKSNVFDMFDRVAKADMSIDFNTFSTSLRNKMFPNSQYQVKNLVKLPVTNLQDMLANELGA